MNESKILLFLLFSFVPRYAMMKCFGETASNCCKRFTRSLPSCTSCNFKNKTELSQVEIDLEYLDDVRYLDTVIFVPPITAGKVVKVYDGDTITIAAKLPNVDSPVYRFSVRLLGIDSAEIKGKTFAEKEIAVRARDALHKLIFGKIVHLKKISTEKYGRILADVYLGDVHLNQWMLDNNYAIPYDGGTKSRPDAWDV